MEQKKNTPARVQANNRYGNKAYDRINIAVKKGEKERIQSYAAQQGKSLNAYIVEAIYDKIKNNDDA